MRADLPLLYAEGDSFPFGGHRVLRRAEAGKAGGGIVLVAAGYMVHSALKAADALQGKEIAVTVVDAYALPMETEPVLALAGPGGTILAIEDSYVGGIGSELAEAAAAMQGAPRVHGLAVHRIPKSGRTPDDVLGYVHLAVDDIVKAAAQLRD